MKRILIFSLAYYPHVGGAEIAIKEITGRISDMEFHMVTMNWGGEAKEEKIGNVIVHRVGNDASYLSKILFAVRAARAARILHREHHFDGLWAMMSYMLFPVVLLRMKGVRLPYLLTLQEGDPWERMFGRWFILPFRFLLTYGFRNATVITTISTYLAGWAKKMGFKGTLEVVPNGVDVAHFSGVHPMSSEAGKTILVTTSRLVHKNGLDSVISALPLLPKTIEFVVYGTGDDEVKLKKLASDCGVSDRVTFKGYIAHTDLPRALSESDIFIRPSRSEGMGNSFVEAMIADLPVIATQEGGIADFLFDANRNPDKETTGWAVDVDSPEQIAEAVQDILAHPDEVARVKANAKKLVSRSYDWNIIAPSMHRLFEGMIGGAQR